MARRRDCQLIRCASVAVILSALDRWVQHAMTGGFAIEDALPRLRGQPTSMHELDEVGWVAGVIVTVYGVRIGIRVNDASLLQQLPQCFPYGWKPSRSRSPSVQRLYSLQRARGEGSEHVLFVNAGVRCRTRDERVLLDVLESDLEWYVAGVARRRVFIHAAAVGWGGQGIVLPGESMSGKSSLVAELVRAGATYYSDEFAVLDGEGRLHPFTTPLSLRVEGGTKSTLMNVEALGGNEGFDLLPVRLVAVCRYVPGARWQPSPLTAGQGTLVLLAHAPGAARNANRILTTVQRAIQDARIVKGERGEAGPTALAILHYLDRHNSGAQDVPSSRALSDQSELDNDPIIG